MLKLPVLRRDGGNICPALGIVVNPFGANIIVPREMLAGMISAKAAQAKQIIARHAAENKVTPFKLPCRTFYGFHPVRRIHEPYLRIHPCLHRIAV